MTLEPSVLISCAVGLLLVALNAFFVLVEFALVRARETQLELLVRQGRGSAAAALGMQRRMDRYLAVSQLGITMASLGLGWVGEPGFAKLLDPLLRQLGEYSGVASHTVSMATAFLMITSLHIVLGEQVPKYIAISRAEGALLRTARPMWVAYIALYVPMMILNWMSNFIVRRIGVPAVTESGTVLSKEEFRLALSKSHLEGKVSLSRVLLCENALDLADFNARSIMVPLEQVVMLDVNKPWSENRQVFMSNRYSRYPLFDGSREKIIGFVHFKDIMLGHMRTGGEVELSKHRRELPRVDALMPLEQLLPSIQRMPTNMVQVVDRATGKPIGILTFEDVLEELVGEITDEFEAERTWRLADVLVPGAMVMDLACQDVAGAVETLAARLAAETPGLDAAEVGKRIAAQGKDIFTVVGKGLAIPHARIPGLARTLVAYGRCSEPIACNTADNKPVRDIFLILTAQEKPREQLRALARIAMLFSSDVLSQSLSDAASAEEVLGVVRAADSLTPLDTR